MILGIGIDICEVDRFKRLVNEEAFLQKVFTPSEISYGKKYKHPAPVFAVRFAAKEAFVKAIGTGIRDGVSLKEIEVIKDKFGKPDLQLHGKTKEVFSGLGGGEICISLSHEKHSAVAVVIIEKEIKYE
ncbi:MAG: holo-ACP synthase [Spirochaetes bacterium]|nr:holo-ACP synthase [Spirochaetota bacterium]